MIFFFENIVESFHIFLVFLMILFTAEPWKWPISTYCLIWPNSIREINGKENYKLSILDRFRSVESEKQKLYWIYSLSLSK